MTDNMYIYIDGCVSNNMYLYRIGMCLTICTYIG